MHISDCETTQDFINEINTIRGFLDFRGEQQKATEQGSAMLLLKDKLDTILNEYDN